MFDTLNWENPFRPDVRTMGDVLANNNKNKARCCEDKGRERTQVELLVEFTAIADDSGFTNIQFYHTTTHRFVSYCTMTP
jgi:hypothetical protein